MEFRGEYYFLSNSYQYPIDLEIEGVTYRFQCAEAAFQACRMPSRAADFQGLTSKEAKEIGKKGRKAEVLQNWNDIRLSEMERVLYAKFKAPTLRAKLLSIGGRIDMENQYNDTFWGLYHGRGQNHLGKLLTITRDRIKEENGYQIYKEPSVVSYKVQKGGVVAFDTETTGTSPKYDDILQITIVGQDGSVLLDTYVKPENSKEWKEAEAINHITPEMVSVAPTVEKVAEVVNKIFSMADAVVGYNVDFDIRMVEARFGFDFKQKEEEMKQISPYKEKWEQNIRDKKEEILSIIAELNDLESKGTLKKDYPESLKKNNTYTKLKKELTGTNRAVNSLTEEEIDIYAEKYANSIYVYDALKDWRIYDAQTAMPHTSHHLTDAMWEFCPEKAGQFETEAHDAAADTVATLEVAEVLYHKLGRDLPIGESPWLNSLFGLKEGIVCQQLNPDGIVSKGFTRRLFQQFPNLRTDFYKQHREFVLNKQSQFGKVHLVPVNDDMQVAFIYSERSKNDIERISEHHGELTDERVLVSRIKAICEKYPEMPVYLPVIITEGKIVDGIGCGKAGAKWEDLEPAFEALKMKNLFYVDTRTGEVKRSYDPSLVMKQTEEILQEEYDVSAFNNDDLDDGIEIG